MGDRPQPQSILNRHAANARFIASRPLSVDLGCMLWVRTFLTELHTWQWIGVLVARTAVGLLFFLSGRGKLFLPERRGGEGQKFLAAHVPFPEFNAVFILT